MAAPISEEFVAKHGGYIGENGVQYLRDHGVEVATVDGPKDPRAAA